MRCTLTPQQEHEIDLRSAAVVKAFDALKGAPSMFKDSTVLMQPDLLCCVAASWVIDEDRHTAFHECKGLKAHKAAAYFAYWFVRMKPIQVMNAGGMPNPQTALINEVFVVYYVCKILNIKLSSVVASKFYHELIYLLRFRKFTAESMFPTMRFLEISAKNGGLALY
ncbi:MAG: hypothetical protein LBU70_06175 [Chitinispirillales bacterium]|jgi:hypothetical protein|nr:hypothetical protein [Chitinispirillales bacterium]